MLRIGGFEIDVKGLLTFVAILFAGLALASIFC